jgi:hypothetical protein
VLSPSFPCSNPAVNWARQDSSSLDCRVGRIAWSLWLFYLGAIATLYGTIFAATAANSRVFADMCRLMGFFESGDYVNRVRFRNGFVVFLTVSPGNHFLPGSISRKDGDCRWTCPGVDVAHHWSGYFVPSLPPPSQRDFFIRLGHFGSIACTTIIVVLMGYYCVLLLQSWWPR